MSARDEQPGGLDRRGLILGGLLLAGGGVAMARQPKIDTPPRTKAEFERMVPRRIGAWTFQDVSGVVLPPSDALSDRLYDAVLTRSYAAPGKTPMMLLVAYSNLQDGMLQVHRPEICYPASGYQLTATTPVEITNGVGGTIAANVFSAAGVSRTEQVLYWTRVGRRFPRRWIEQRVAIVRANLEGEIPDGVLVRVSNLDPDMTQALPDLTEFASTLIRELGPEGRQLIAGRS